MIYLFHQQHFFDFHKTGPCFQLIKTEFVASLYESLINFQ